VSVTDGKARQVHVDSQKLHAIVVAGAIADLGLHRVSQANKKGGVNSTATWPSLNSGAREERHSTFAQGCSAALENRGLHGARDDHSYRNVDFVTGPTTNRGGIVGAFNGRGFGHELPPTEASAAVARDLGSKRRRLPVVYIIPVIGHCVAGEPP
jgi:hypothetical protein